MIRRLWVAQLSDRCRWSMSFALRLQSGLRSFNHSMHLILCIHALASFFIANSSSHSYLIASSSRLFYNGTTKSPSQAPTARPMTLDPTKASNVTIPCGMIQQGSSFSCIFWLLSVALFALSHYLSIYPPAQQRTTNIRHQHLLPPQVIRRLWVAQLPDHCSWSTSPALQMTCLHVCEVHRSFHVSYLVRIFMRRCSSPNRRILNLNRLPSPVGSDSTTQWLVAFNKESQPSTYG